MTMAFASILAGSLGVDPTPLDGTILLLFAIGPWVMVRFDPPFRELNSTGLQIV